MGDARNCNYHGAKTLTKGPGRHAQPTLLAPLCRQADQSRQEHVLLRIQHGRHICIIIRLSCVINVPQAAKLFFLACCFHSLMFSLSRTTAYVDVVILYGPTHVSTLC